MLATPASGQYRSAGPTARRVRGLELKLPVRVLCMQPTGTVPEPRPANMTLYPPMWRARPGLAL